MKKIIVSMLCLMIGVGCNTPQRVGNKVYRYDAETNTCLVKTVANANGETPYSQVECTPEIKTLFE